VGRKLASLGCSFLMILSIFVSMPAFATDMPELIGTLRSDTINTQYGYRILPLGDQNNDGFSDLMVWSYTPRFKYFLYYGGASVDTVPALCFDNVNSRSNLVGDVNRDGYDDVVAQGRSSFGWKLNLYYGGPDIDSVRDLWFGDDTLYAYGYTVFGDDINGNGTDELISWSSHQRSVVFFELGTSPDSTPDFELAPANWENTSYDAFGEGLMVGDFNGDGKKDFGCSLRPKSKDSLNGSVYLYWGSFVFDTIPDMIINGPGAYSTDKQWFGEFLVSLGDFSGDGYDDFYVGHHANQDTISFIYFGGPDIDSVPDILIPGCCENAYLAGDINSDGYNDLITSDHLPFSGAGHVSIYYGGPDADSVYDIRIHNWQDPLYQLEFGLDCAGIGDFNGDGVDDFAFSAIHSQTGEVYIYSGFSGNGTGVDYDYEAVIPEDFVLSQNYPNPFNMKRQKLVLQFTIYLVKK